LAEGLSSQTREDATMTFPGSRVKSILAHFHNKNMPADQQKRNAAAAAMEYVKPGSIIGVGTGSTVNHFIDFLGESMANEIQAAVSSSEASTERLIEHGIKVLDMNDCGRLDVYVDGADESNHQLHLIKGGGGALTREKIVAAASEIFVCIADESKLVDTLGTFPLPVEVIPMARRMVSRILNELGGNAEWREGFVTDNGNHILDVSGLSISDPIQFETTINQIAGVVTCGLFAHRPADVLILGLDQGHRSILAR
jgi:ribose 5-phosphate isomerase A